MTKDLRMSDLRSRFAQFVPLSTLLVCLCLIIVVPAGLQAVQGGKTEILPAQKSAPPAVVIEASGTEDALRRQLRTKNEVRALAADARFSTAPTGSFGFLPPQALAMALVTQSPDLMLEPTAPSPNAYEVHKLTDGSGMVVGFVGPDLLTQLTPSQRPKTVRLTLYSNPSDKFPYIVAVPLVKLSSDRMPTWLDRKNPAGVVKFEMDLLGSANRKSVPGAQ
jgi:hypothetical protein